MKVRDGLVVCVDSRTERREHCVCIVSATSISTSPMEQTVLQELMEWAGLESRGLEVTSVPRSCAGPGLTMAAGSTCTASVTVGLLVNLTAVKRWWRRICWFLHWNSLLIIRLLSDVKIKYGRLFSSGERRNFEIHYWKILKLKNFNITTVPQFIIFAKYC
jgi:hypothetical protein